MLTAIWAEEQNKIYASKTILLYTQINIFFVFKHKKIIVIYKHSNNEVYNDVIFDIGTSLQSFEKVLKSNVETKSVQTFRFVAHSSNALGSKLRQDCFPLKIV